MDRLRALSATLLLAVVGLLLLPGTALATTTADVAAALRSNPVYVDAKATASVDAAALREAIGATGRPIYVAVLPQAAADGNGGAAGVTAAIGRQLPSSAVLITVTGTTVYGDEGPTSGLGQGQAESIVQDSRGGDLTAQLLNSVGMVGSVAAGGTSPGSRSGGFGSGSGTGTSSGPGGAVALGLLAALGLGGGGVLYARSRTRRSRELQGMRADVESLYNRLGSDVANLSPGDDPVTRQALADAAERYTATGALLSQSDTPGEFAAARRTVVEGLAAARVARTRLGLDPGPEVPPPPGTGPQLQAEQRVQVGDQAYDGSPTYQPGRQHYFGGGVLGGRMVPGGWYGVPFWETLLIGSALSGGFGGGGYERGYEEGVHDSGDARGDGGSGGGWGGGGDWGGGGGGGGDWGGGGGGGGSGGGGSW